MGYKCSVLGYVVCLFIQVQCRPDFGVPKSFPETSYVAVSAKLFLDSLNELLVPLRRIPAKMHGEIISNAAESISQLVLNVMKNGKSMAEFFAKAAYERDTSIRNLFESYYGPHGEMENLRIDVSPVYKSDLAERIGNVSANEFIAGLLALGNASAECFKAMRDLESRVNNALKGTEDESVPLQSAIASLPSTLPRGLGTALLAMRNQVRLFVKVVDGSARSVEKANSILNTVYTMRGNAKTSFVTSKLYLMSMVNTENDLALNKYKATQKKILTDVADAIKRLSIFSANKTLSALTDVHTQAYTNSYYVLHNREQADMALIGKCYDAIRSNITEFFQTIDDQSFPEVRKAADSLATTMLARGNFTDRCVFKYATKVTNSFAPLQSEVQSCASRERTRLPRITDAMDKIFQLALSNSADFSADIGSCARFSAFATKREDYQQAKACLESNPDEMQNFDRVIGTELDALRTILDMEPASSALRINRCITQSVIELKALMEGTKAAIEQCAAEGP